MGANSTRIDREKLRVAIRRMGGEYLYYMLDDAIELLPPSKLVKLAGREDGLEKPEDKEAPVSEYQYYEWQSVDRLLTETEREA